jgi:hypothetical protein
MSSNKKNTDKKDTDNILTLDLSTVSKTRKWVSSLPLTDMGATTRQLFLGLTHLNQESIAPQLRIDITEVILPYVKMVLENLDRHFLSRSFPLPERSQKIFDLKKSLQMETAGSYQLAALEMLTKSMVSKKKLLLAIGRAVDYMSQVLMNSYEVYVKHDKAIWHDIHHLFLMACENKVDKKAIPNKDDTQDNEMSIEDHYKLINLVALAAPNTLRQGEAAKIYKFFKQCVNDISILENASKVKAKYAHITLLNSDEPASLMPVSDLVNSPTSRLFDLSSVINHLDEFVSLSECTDLGTHEKWPMLTHSLAKRLVYVLTTIRNRRFKRFPRDEKLTLAIRMADVIEMIRENDIDSFEEQINEDVEDDNIYEALADADSVESPWSDIDLDSMADGYDVQLHSWQAENSSSGGYGLRQIKSEASTARVGELVAVKDPKDEADLWQIAVIRWMDSFRGIGLKTGLEILSLHGMTVTVDEICNREISQKLPMEGILLPTIDGARKEANLIFPGFIFHVGDELTLTMGSREQHVSITSIDDTVGNFSYCGFENIEVEEIEEGSLESFDDVWEFL